MTYEEAEAILCGFYNDTWSTDDPEWWQEMIEFIMESESADAAREWLR